MHGGYMRVAVKSPGKPWDSMWVENKLDTLQHIVGGYIEHTTALIMGNDGVKTVHLLVDEEGLIKGKPWNGIFQDGQFCGTIIAIGVDGDEFTDLPEEIMKELVE